MFLCNVAFLHPPATANFFEVCAGFRNLDIYTCFLSYGFEEKYDFEKGGGQIMSLTTNIHPCPLSKQK